MTDREEIMLRAWQCVTAARVDALEAIVGKMLAPAGEKERFLASWLRQRTRELVEDSLRSIESEQPVVAACARQILESTQQAQKAEGA